MEKGNKVSAIDVLLFIPNIIDFSRIILYFTAFYFARTNYVITTSCFIVGIILDEFDGRAARYFHQESKLGAMLDIMTDRVGNVCLILNIVNFYPGYTLLFQLSVYVDIVGHWLYIHHSAFTGSYHQDMKGGNYFLRHYYSNRMLLSLLVDGNEIFHLMLYLLHFTEGPMLNLPGLNIGLVRLALYAFTPVMVAKCCFFNVVHLYDSIWSMAKLDADLRNDKEAKEK
uniref:CDP-diacylglycerol--inositol 3-phosphatidyltransferase-like n=1 Tax=Styela clava TaxID=7725 RepID=UPI00193A8BA9|nr:CDP-diacylglycerol--inositol 3-phosphatidyltransferase-like [Styela clava]